VTIAAVAFDLDGTLACLPIDWETLFEEFKTIMHIDVVRPLVETVSRTDSKTREEVFAAWDKAELAIFRETTPCKNGMKLYLDYKDKPKALVTLQGKEVVRLLIERLTLSFDVVITREDSLSRPEQLLIAAKKLKISKEDLLFVGNADSDTAAAKTIGCQFQRVS
jgi:HAD superfamily hydrolase (TIGR01549 family)